MVIDTRDGSGHFLHTKESLTQGDPLVMITYGIEVLPLIRELWGKQPRVTHLWYTNDTGEGVKLPHILAHLQDLQAGGPAKRLLTETEKNCFWLCSRGMYPVQRISSKGWGYRFWHGAGILGGLSGRERRRRAGWQGNSLYEKITWRP